MPNHTGDVAGILALAKMVGRVWTARLKRGGIPKIGAHLPYEKLRYG